MSSATRDLLVLALIASACNSAPVKAPVPQLGLRTESNAVRVLVDDETFARVALGISERICITDLRAPGGQDVLRGFPLQPRVGESTDHPEQTGIWMAHASIDGEDFWNGRGGTFATEHSLRLGRSGEALVDARIEWRGASGTVLCTETRSYTFRNAPTARTVDIVHHIAPTGSGLVLGDVREGFFALRLADAFRVRAGSTSARSFSSMGARGEELWGQPARWVAHIAEFTGSDGASEYVTVCTLDHPGNAQHPPIWNAHAYGLVAANPFGRVSFALAGSAHDGMSGDGVESGALLLDGYETLTMRYRIIIAPSALGYNDVDTLWTEFATEERPR